MSFLHHLIPFHCVGKRQSKCKIAYIPKHKTLETYRWLRSKTPCVIIPSQDGGEWSALNSRRIAHCTPDLSLVNPVVDLHLSTIEIPRLPGI